MNEDKRNKIQFFISQLPLPQEHKQFYQQGLLNASSEQIDKIYELVLKSAKSLHDVVELLKQNKQQHNQPTDED